MFLVYDKLLTYYKNIPTTTALQIMKPHFYIFKNQKKRYHGLQWLTCRKLVNLLDNYLHYLSDILIVIIYMQAMKKAVTEVRSPSQAIEANLINKSLIGLPSMPIWVSTWESLLMLRKSQKRVLNTCYKMLWESLFF